MKTLSFAVAAGFIFCGCSSVVNSTLEPRDHLPKPGQVVSDIPYYLPKGKIIVAGTWNKEARLWDIKITPVIEADPSARYLADRHINILFDDDITISVDPNTGLLQTVNATTTDQSLNAIAGLISTAASALTFGAGLGPLPTGGATEQRMMDEFAEIKKGAFFSAFQVVLDDQGASKEAYVVSPDQETNKLYAKFNVVLSALDNNPGTDADAHSETNFPGILVRRMIPFSVRVTANVYTFDGKSMSPFTSPSQTVMLPDAKHDYCIELTRTPLVANTTKVSLVNGIPQTQQRVRPSIFMGIVGVPKTLLGALAPIPLQIRNDQLNLLNAQDKTLSAEQDIKKSSKPQ